MALRVLEVQVSAGSQEIAETVLNEVGASDVWTESGGSFGRSVRAVIGAERTGKALDVLHERLSGSEGFRILVTPLDAVLPRPTATAASDERNRPNTFASVSREEVYAAVQEGTRVTGTYLLMVMLATVVAAIGLVRNNTAAVIGAMVVAPLLGPNMAVALGFSLGDRKLIREALRASGTGVAVAFAMSILLGWLIGVDPSVPEVAARTQVALTDMLLAFAAGAAGTVAYTSGAPTYLVGVMVAVALLPPTVASGLLTGSGYLREAYGALLLVATNVAAVTLAAMVTFRVTGMRPRHWWGEERARVSARLGLVVFAVLGCVLAALVVWSGALLER
jgi:uncharacterized hydrophobic protein (TIGR00341 family)